MEPVVVYRRRLNTVDRESAPGVARRLQKWRENQKWKTIAKWQGDADNDVEPRCVSASCATHAKNHGNWRLETVF